MSQPSPSTEAQLGAVLVTGGCGFLGSNIVRGLLREPTCTSISVLSRNPTINLQKGASYHACDVSNLSRLQDLFNDLNPTTVMHVASPRLEASDKELYQANIVGTKNLLKCATECAATKVFVYTSSDSASAPMKGDIMMTEDNLEMYNEHTLGIVMYQKSKGTADILTIAANSVKLRTTSLRVPGLYGEDDTNFIRATLEQLKKGQHKFQVGDNKTIRDYLYIDSCVLAHILAAKALLEGKEGVAGEGFLISDGEGGMPMYDASRKIVSVAKLLKILSIPWHLKS
jgi:sterol-4alpha-carboxylate 3-dehydrogenase (decarboxylating)